MSTTARRCTAVTETNLHGLITCVMSPYIRQEGRRNRLPPLPCRRSTARKKQTELPELRSTARRPQARQQPPRTAPDREVCTVAPVSASQQESPTLWRRTEVEARLERTLRTAGTVVEEHRDVHGLQHNCTTPPFFSPPPLPPQPHPPWPTRRLHSLSQESTRRVVVVHGLKLPVMLSP